MLFLSLLIRNDLVYDFMGVSIMVDLLNTFAAHCPMCIGKYSHVLISCEYIVKMW